jgi:hypothetical protein
MANSRYIAFIALLSIILWANNASAQPDVIRIAFEISNIAQIDLTTATFWLDAALRMTFQNGTSYYGAVRVGNRGGNPIWTNGPAPRLGALRMFSSLQFVPNLAKFPFDSQTLELSITHPSLNANYLEWEPDVPASFISDLVRLEGWTYSNSSLSLSTRLEKYAADNSTYHQVRLSIFVRRAIPGGIQTLLSPSFALIMVFVSFWLPVTEGITRISMATAALVSEVFIHVSLRNSALLNLNSLVIMDGFMILCYGVILCAILTNVIIVVLLRGSESDKVFARRLGSRVRYVIWFFGPGVFTFLFFPVNMLYVPFICIIFPSVIALGIRLVVIRYKRYSARQQPPKDHPLEADSDGEESSESISDPEDKAPSPLAYGTEMSPLREHIVRQEALAKGKLAHQGSFNSVSSSE